MVQKKTKKNFWSVFWSIPSRGNIQLLGDPSARVFEVFLKVSQFLVRVVWRIALSPELSAPQVAREFSRDQAFISFSRSFDVGREALRCEWSGWPGLGKGCGKSLSTTRSEMMRCCAFALRPSRCRSLQKLNSESAAKRHHTTHTWGEQQNRKIPIDPSQINPVFPLTRLSNMKSLSPARDQVPTQLIRL